MKETLCPRCGESVVFQDMGDNPAFLIGECESCHLKGEYLEGQRFKWQALNDRELRLNRARTALRKAIQSENAKYNPSINLINSYTDGLEALEGIK
jgi:ribosomal protein S27AE